MKKIYGLLCAVVLMVVLIACGSATGSGTTWQEQYDLGMQYLMDGDYEAAIVAFTAAIDIETNDIRTYTGLVQAYIGQTDYDSAVITTDEGLSVMIAAEQEQAESAVDDFASVAIEAYEWVEDVDELYLFWSALSDYYADTEKWQQIQENAGAALYELGLMYLDLEEYDSAISAFEKCLEFDPSNADAYVGLVESYMGLGEMEKAQEYADEGYALTGDERLLLQNEEESAAAQDDEPGITLADITEEPVQTGSCGPNAVWSYYEGIKALVISGSGEVQDYNDGPTGRAPWSDFSNNFQNNFLYDIQYLIVEEGITRLGSNTFYGATALQYVSLPSTLVEISDYEFSACWELIAFTVAEGNTTYLSDHGVLYEKDSEGKMTLLYYPRKKTASSYTVLSGTTLIAEEAFVESESLCSVKIPATVMEISECAFLGCTSLSDISLSDGLIRIASSAFWICTSLETLEIPATVIDFTTDYDSADAWLYMQQNPMSVYFYGNTAPAMDGGIAACFDDTAGIVIYYLADATGWDVVQQQISGTWRANIISFEAWTPAE